MILAAGLAFSGPASAQPMSDPAPGATGPYVGAGPQGFYDVDARLAAIAGRIAALPPGQRRRAGAQIHQIRAEEATQRARHGGELRDWDRENMTQKLDQLIQQYPMLRADAG